MGRTTTTTAARTCSRPTCSRPPAPGKRSCQHCLDLARQNYERRREVIAARNAESSRRCRESLPPLEDSVAVVLAGCSRELREAALAHMLGGVRERPSREVAAAAHEVVLERARMVDVLRWEEAHP